MPERTALVTALILERPTCLPCIAQRAGLTLDALDTVLTVVSRVLRLEAQEASRCRQCGEDAVVFWIASPE